MNRARSNVWWSSLLPILALLAVASPAGAQEVTDALLADFERSFEAARQTYHVPGSAVAIVRDGEIVYAKGFGMRNLETQEPVTTATVFRVGSTAKAMTSMMIATLVDDGVLAWDRPVHEIYPDFALPTEELTRSATLSDLLGMGTGLASNIPSPHWDEYDASALLAALATFPVAGAKGETYLYNNEVFAAAGYVAALAAEPANDDLLATYARLMQARVFDPIGMDAAALSDDPAGVSDDHAVSYSFTLAGGPEATERVPFAPIHAVAPAGAVVTNVLDMARFLLTQLNGGVSPAGERVVSTENLHRTWQPQTEITERPPGTGPMRYAMGWIEEPYDDVRVLWHNGGWEGFTSEMAMLPEADAGIVILSNSTMGGVLNLVMRYRFIELLHGLEPRLSEQVGTFFQAQIDELGAAAANVGSATVDAALVEPYLGDYQHGWRLEHRDDGTLWLARPGWQLQFLSTPQGFVANSGVVFGATLAFADEGTLLFTFEGETLELPRR